MVSTIDITDITCSQVIEPAILYFGLATGGLIPVLLRNGNATGNAKQTIRPYTVRR